MIKIIDNQLPERLLLDCVKEAEQAKNYTVMHGAGDGTYGFKYNWMFCSEEDQGIIENDSLYNLWDEVKKHIPYKVRLSRAYVNAHTYGVEDSIHTDDSELNNGITIIVYLCSTWYPEWFGQTIFFSHKDRHSHNDVVQSVMPRFNRVLMFDANIPHCVSPLSRRFSGIRLTCMFKVEPI